MTIDIGELLDSGPWPRLGKLVTILCALAIVFDGFDISIIGFAIPAIIRDWHLTRAAFAPLLVIGLVGMIVGSVSAGLVGDRIGRRAALLLSLLLFGLATAVSAFAPNLFIIEVLRFIAAAGIGGAMPTATTMSGEFTPLKNRPAAVMLTIVCIPLGGALAGSVAALVLPVAGWRALFLIGGLAPMVLSLVMAFFTPESPRFLTRQSKRAAELAKLLARLGHSVPAEATFVERVADRPGTSMLWNDFFAAGQARNTLSLWLAFFAGAANVYMCLSWLPALLAAGGFNLALASQGLAAYNYGGVLGVVCFAILVNRFGSRVLTLTCASLAVLTALILVFVLIKPGSSPLPLLGALAAQGFFVNAVQSSFFALSVYLYPTRVRATGVAAASAVGRLGGIVSATVGPVLVQSGQQAYFKYLAVAMACAFVALSVLRNHIPRMQQQKVLINS